MDIVATGQPSMTSPTQAPAGSERFGFIATLGRGGMADVYLVSARGVADFVKLLVVKELRPELAEDADFVEMFLSEARVAARLHSPHIVQTYDIERTNRRLLLTMEFLDGQPLHRVLARLERTDPRFRTTALHCVVESLRGLQYAHELADYDGTALDIVHRDVSPHNLFVLYSGHVKLVDFGIAKVTGGSVETRSGVIKGKAGYMAPEQVQGSVIDRRADLFACGVILWEALAGQRLWAGLDDRTIVARLLQSDVPSIRAAVPNAPPSLLRVCERALSVRPADRYQSAQEMREDLVTGIDQAGLTISADELALTMNSLFAEERDTLTNLIRSHMDKLTRTTSFEHLHQVTSAAEPVFKDGADHIATTVVQTGPLSAGTASAATLSKPTPPARRWVGAVLGVSGLALVSFLVLSGPRKQPPQPGPTATKASADPSSDPGITPQATPCDTQGNLVVELTGEIEVDATLTCDRTYLLRFNVFVTPGVTLTINPGTTIRGDRATHGTLVVRPGARLIADGKADAPIVFTSAQPVGQQRAGDWGGIVLLGQAPLNLHDDSGKALRGRVEGLTLYGSYGGDQVRDDSGVLRYVRIEYPGRELAPGNELNGLTLAGVGSGTTIQYVQVREASDDCFEFFGGTVTAKHLICQSSGDDGFDWDYGYQGTLQYLILQNRPATHGADNGLEGDNDPNGSSNEPTSAPSIYNATLVGATRNEGTTLPFKTHGILARRGTAGLVSNSIVLGFDTAVSVRDLGTRLRIERTLFLGNRRVVPPAEEDGTSAGDQVFTGRAGELTDPFDLVAPDFLPKSTYRVEPHVPPVGVQPTDYAGAVRDSDDRWYLGAWTRWDSQ